MQRTHARISHASIRVQFTVFNRPRFSRRFHVCLRAPIGTYAIENLQRRQSKSPCLAFDRCMQTYKLVFSDAMHPAGDEQSLGTEFVSLHSVART